MSLKTLLRATVGRRLCGALPERPGRHLVDFEHLGLATAGDEVSSLVGALPSYAPLDQQFTGSCVIQAWALGEVATMRARYGIDSPLPSRRYGYYWARQRDGGAIIDDGCKPSIAFRAIAELGLPPESSFEWSQFRINQRPPLSARWDAVNHIGRRDSFQVYYSSIWDRIYACRAAIKSGRAFTIVIPVGNEFESCKSTDPITYPASSIRGTHAVLGIDCSTTGYVTIVNSWGTNWGRNGIGVLSPEYLENSSSIIVIDPKEAVQ